MEHPRHPGFGGTLADPMDGRVVVFAHYDPDHRVDPYVYFYLDSLRQVSDRIVFVSTADLSGSDLERLNGLCTHVVIRENSGYDFLSYRAGLSLFDWQGCSEVVLCNDSVYGPLFPMGGIFSIMEKAHCDFWGMTGSCDMGEHLQSYFLVFKNTVLASGAFRRFWQNVTALEKKTDVIMNYEIGLSRILAGAGFVPGTYVHMGLGWLDLIRYLYRHPSIRGRRTLATLAKDVIRNKRVAFNVTHVLWHDIIARQQMPFVKVALLRDNPLSILNVPNYPALLAEISDYPTALIQAHLNRVGGDD